MFVIYISDDSKPELYWILGLILGILICWLVLRELTVTQNYKIDKNVIVEDSLKIETNYPILMFSRNLKIEITEFDMPMGVFRDYRNYRIYFDSLTYIDIKDNSYDSLDLKYGKKLYKE